MDDQTSEPERQTAGETAQSASALDDEPDEQAPRSKPPGPRTGRRKQLTRREQEIASLIGAGLTSRHVAERLVISERTVDSHAEHIRDKLGLHSRAQIAAWAVNAGLVEHPPGACSWLRGCP